MHDPFLNRSWQLMRLLEEYQKHKGLIIAFDLDGTINDFHGKGFKFPKLIALLKRAKKHGCFLMCFTAHPDEMFVREKLKELDIIFDSINQTPGYIKIPLNPAKPYYNILLDDRAGLDSTYKTLCELFKFLES